MQAKYHSCSSVGQLGVGHRQKHGQDVPHKSHRQPQFAPFRRLCRCLLSHIFYWAVHRNLANPCQIQTLFWHRKVAFHNRRTYKYPCRDCPNMAQKKLVPCLSGGLHKTARVSKSSSIRHLFLQPLKFVGQKLISRCLIPIKFLIKNDYVSRVWCVYVWCSMYDVLCSIYDVLCMMYFILSCRGKSIQNRKSKI